MTFLYCIMSVSWDARRLFDDVVAADADIKYSGIGRTWPLRWSNPISILISVNALKSATDSYITNFNSGLPAANFRWHQSVKHANHEYTWKVSCYLIGRKPREYTIIELDLKLRSHRAINTCTVSIRSHCMRKIELFPSFNKFLWSKMNSFSEIKKVYFESYFSISNICLSPTSIPSKSDSSIFILKYVFG